MEFSVEKNYMISSTPLTHTTPSKKYFLSEDSVNEVERVWMSHSDMSRVPSVVFDSEIAFPKNANALKPFRTFQIILLY